MKTLFKLLVLIGISFAVFTPGTFFKAMIVGGILMAAFTGALDYKVSNNG